MSSTPSRATTPNILLMIEEHGAGFLKETDEEIVDLRKRLELAIAKRERIRAILAVHRVNEPPGETAEMSRFLHPTVSEDQKA